MDTQSRVAAPTSAEADLQPGTPVGEYVVEDKLGEGGFGSVFRARHPLIGKLAAVKVLARKYSADPEIVSRFMSEARAVNQIRHRNIVDIFAFGQLDDGRSYFVMELLEGVPLAEHIRETGGVTLAEALPILRAIGRALDAAHAKGIAHRDLKPENIMLARDDDGPLPKLLDFGIAKLLGETGFSTKHKTRTGTPMGTPYYMSPEQARGDDIDHRTDLYSFGCVAYELLTGRVPFDGNNHLEIMFKQCQEEPVAPSTLAALPPAVDDTIAWLMKKDAAARPPSVMTAVNALEEVAGVPMSRLTPVPGRATPVPASRGSQQKMALASTVAEGSSGAIGSAQTLAPVPATRTRARWPLAVGAALVVGGALTLIATRGEEAAPPATPPAPTVVMPPPAPPTLPAVAPLSPNVELAIRGVPDGTDVFGPSGPLGTTPGAIQLPRGTAALQITLRADGFAQKTLRVTPDRDQTLEVTLDELVEKPVPTATTTTRPRPTTAKPRPRPTPAPTTKPKPPVQDPYTRQ